MKFTRELLQYVWYVPSGFFLLIVLLFENLGTIDSPNNCFPFGSIAATFDVEVKSECSLHLNYRIHCFSYYVNTQWTTLHCGHSDKWQLNGIICRIEWAYLNILNIPLLRVEKTPSIFFIFRYDYYRMFFPGYFQIKKFNLFPPSSIIMKTI